MKRNRTGVTIAIIVIGLVFALGAYQFVQFLKVVGVKDNRVVQILESPDGQLKAQLIRKYDFLDLNFIIELNGDKIYRSEDFRPNYTIPFRETILWDKTGKNLIFEIDGYRLFGYSVTEKRRLSEKELLSLQVQNLKPEDFGFAGQWPSLHSENN
jgi:hypothetical protein